MNDSIHIREFEEKDYSSLLEIWREYKAWGADNPENIEVIKRTINMGGCMLVAQIKDSNKMVGSGWITFDGRLYYMHHLGVLSAYRKRGIGEKLFVELMKRRKYNLPISIEVHCQNKGIKAVYKGLEYEEYPDYIPVLIQ